MFLIYLIIVVIPLLTAGCGPKIDRRCECHSWYTHKGCFIKNAAPEGFKCLCTPKRYMSSRRKGLWYCTEKALPCRNDEACPGGRYSYCACSQGGGNCDAYPIRPSTVQSCQSVNKVEASSSLRQYTYQNCKCTYYNGGCHITVAAQEGFKCVCKAGRCSANAIGCDEDEYCPAGDHTYCACLRGGGDCNGYSDRDKRQSCDLGTTCNCNRATDWTKGQYSVTSVTCHTDNMVRTDPELIEIGHQLDVPNASAVELSQRMNVQKSKSTTSSFERTSGMSVDLGVAFKAIVPIDSLTPSTTVSYKFGESNVTTDVYSHWYKCSSPPYTHTRCTAHLMRSKATVPYTMILKHKRIPNCECASYGNWKSATSFFSQLVAEQIGPCPRIVSGSCVTP